MFPYEELMLEDGLADKPILLSYRSQQMLLMALTKMETRYNWFDMEDTAWDELENYIAHTETEILTLIEDYPVTPYIHQAARTTVQNIVANTITPIVFNQGQFDVTNNNRLYAPFDGYATLTAQVQLTGAVNLKWAAIRENGTTIKAKVQIPVAGAFYSFSMAITDVFSTSWYYELIVFGANTATTTVHTEFNPVLSFYGITS
jgi:hypothetical protein